MHIDETFYKFYCSTVHFLRKHLNLLNNGCTYNFTLNTFKTLRHVSILSDHHEGALFLAKAMLQCSQFNSYLQTR